MVVRFLESGWDGMGFDDGRRERKGERVRVGVGEGDGDGLAGGVGCHVTAIGGNEGGREGQD